MASYTKVPLSGSTDYQPIAVVATSIGSGTTIHTAQAGVSPDADEVYLLVSNIDSVSHQLTLQWGASGATQLMCTSVSIPPNSGPIMVVPGIPIQNAGVIKAAADVASKLNISGFVNRIS